MKLLLWILLALLPLAPFSRGALLRPEGEVDYAADVEFALAELQKRCGPFFQTKGIDWRKVEKDFRKEVKTVKTDADEWLLLIRLLARVRDGHAEVQRTELTGDLTLPKELFPELAGPGMFWCRIGKKVYVRESFGEAKELGILPGMEVLKVDGEKVEKWLAARIAVLSDRECFSTDHQADFFARNWGLAHERNTRLKLELKDHEGKGIKRTVACVQKSFTPNGPMAYPAKMAGDNDVYYCALEGSLGYIHVRRCKGGILEGFDEALAALGNLRGLIIDFRGNPGGGFDHDALLGRFVPKGQVFHSNKDFASTGETPYGGPIVVIVDGTVRSAAETGSGMFKEEGRGYMIGESPTAGMSAVKETIELPSGRFRLYVAVQSNKARWQGGRGIEGLGVEPHEIVAFEVADLIAGKDTLIERARTLLGDFPAGKVAYNPGQHGWTQPQ